MPTFASHDGLDINYVDEGAGDPVVLVHGFAASIDANWRAPGVIEAIVAAGRRVLALDCRGHGKSAKPHDPNAYSGTKMGDDVIALMDHCGVQTADLIGYSMGSFISSTLLTRRPDRFRSVILGGVGDGMLTWGRRDPQQSARATDAATTATSSVDVLERFRAFAEAMGNDVKALAASQQARREMPDPSRLRNVTLPVLVLRGKDDEGVGSAEKLASMIPGARAQIVPGDHMSAVAQPAFREAIVDWLAARAQAR